MLLSVFRFFRNNNFYEIFAKKQQFLCFLFFKIFSTFIVFIKPPQINMMIAKILVFKIFCEKIIKFLVFGKWRAFFT